jgi:LmbE family N-acetylglucosaminyl deacetylase
MNILAIGAHPDDLEISCAGTLAKMKQHGHNVTLCHVTNGDKGHYQLTPDVLAAMRRKEAQAAGLLIGCEVVSLGMKDCEILSGDEQARATFTDVIRYAQPDMVITHAPNDYMPDHIEVSKLVLDTTFFATVTALKSSHPVLPKVPVLHYMDNLSGIHFQPTIYVDITDTMDTKLNMLRCHQSQLQWLEEHDNVDIIDFVETHAKSRGYQSGCRYAEGFIQCMAWTRPNAMRFPV